MDRRRIPALALSRSGSTGVISGSRRLTFQQHAAADQPSSLVEPPHFIDKFSRSGSRRQAQVRRGGSHKEVRVRRREKEIQKPEILDELLRNTQVCRIGLAPSKAPGYPYVVPVHFVHDQGRIYVHSARAGKKISMLGENPRVCVEMDDLIELKSADKACDYGTRFRSLIAFGTARIVEQREDKGRALRLLMEKYSGRSFDFSGQEIQRVAIIEIQLEEVTGKQG